MVNPAAPTADSMLLIPATVLIGGAYAPADATVAVAFMRFGFLE